MLFSECVFEGPRPFGIEGRDMTVTRREFAHELASVIMPYSKQSSRRFETGTPVSMRWGWQPNGMDKFFGYVHHTEPIQVPSRAVDDLKSLVKVVCVGTTFYMKEKRMRAWQDRTVSSVAREILREYQLSAILQEHATVWPSLMCNGVSDWEFLRSLANRVGWTLVPYQSDIIFRERLAGQTHMRDTAPVFVAAMPGMTESTVISMNTVDGELTKDGGSLVERQQYGMDARTLQPFYANDDASGLNAERVARWTTAPTFGTFETTPADTYGSAVEELGNSAKRNRWFIQAKAEVRGDTRVRPGMLVVIDGGVGVRERGYWYVQAVAHEVKGDAFRSVLSLGRDSQWDSFDRPEGPRRRRVIRPRNDPFGVQKGEQPPTLLVNNIWRAAYAAERPVTGVA